MITKKNCFQIETNEKYFIIRMTADVRKWKFIPAEVANSINRAIREMEAQGLTPAPFGVEVTQ